MFVILQRLIVPVDLKLGTCICLVIVQVECTHLRLARVSIQRVFSVIVGQTAQSMSGLDCVERCRLGSKAEIIGIDEPACEVKLCLIICVNVKQCRCQY
ncbi:hypothetical protein ElyMa_006660000 [Elysia marginata]|uniref:Secreted protein n=1 Tax=Elysia marginata TaxID=1093978 RepID=A0AAV4ILL4_9GAST|nr:hypothetical protein ElyMa_006660000 [Elysia marginata]